MAERRVICLTHSYFHDTRTGVTFHERVVPVPGHEDGKDAPRVHLGVADDVDAELVAEFYADHPAFRAEGYEAAVSSEGPEGGEGDGDSSDGDQSGQETDESGESAAADTAQAGSGDEDQEDEDLAPDIFGSPTAEALADEHGLVAADFDGVAPTGKTGFTADDVRNIAKAKAGAEADGS